jgi:hypothetical protein
MKKVNFNAAANESTIGSNWNHPSLRGVKAVGKLLTE